MSHREDKSYSVQSRSGKVTVVNEGYLKKKSPKKFMGFAQWQDRWFVLRTDALLYFKTDRAHRMGQPPSGTIPVTEIRVVSIPQDHKDGCRLDIETTSRRVFELQAASASICQRWINLLTVQCRSVGALADLSDEKAVDAQHERDLALMMSQTGTRGGGTEKDAAGNPLQPLGPEPDFTDDELISVDPEIVREVDQFSVSVSLDLHGANADKIAPFVVLFAPSDTSRAAAPPTPAATATAAPEITAASAFAAALAATAVETPAPVEDDSNATRNSQLSIEDDPAVRRSETYFRNLEIILGDASFEKSVFELASTMRPPLTSLLLLYAEIRAFKLSTTAATQATAATQIWQRFLRKGAADFVSFPPMTPRPSATAATSSALDTAAIAPTSVVDAVHTALKSRAVTLTTFDPMLRTALRILRRDFWPAYVLRHPHVLGHTPTAQAGLTFNPAQLHPSQRKITGAYSSATGVQVAYSRQGTQINGNPLKDWDELCRTEVLPRLGKKALALTPGTPSLTAVSASSSSAASASPASSGASRHHKASVIGGDFSSRVSERRHFDILLGVNLDVGVSERTGAEKRVRRLNGLAPTPATQGTISPLAPATPAAIAAARARRASAVRRKSAVLLEPPTGAKRRSSSFDAGASPVGARQLTAALAAAAQTKALDEADASLGRIALSEEDEDEAKEDNDDDVVLPSLSPTAAAHSMPAARGTDLHTPPSIASASFSFASSASSSPSLSDAASPADASATTTTAKTTITVDRNLKTLRFHLYHSTDINNEDLSSHVLLARCECTLKEIIFSDNGELTRALFIVDPQATGLSGFIHLMFHDRRRIKIASTPRYCYRSYIFRDVSHQDLICHESLQESPFTFQLPHAALLRAVEQTRLMRKQVMQHLSATDVSISSGRHTIEEESQKSKMLSFLQRQVKAYTAVIAQWERLIKLYANYHGSYRGLRFKPSVEKSARALGFLPINCHVQSFTVTHTGRSRSRPVPAISSTLTVSPLHAHLYAGGSLAPQRLTASRAQTISAANGSSAGGGGDSHAPGSVIEPSSFVFEQADFLTELRQAHLRQTKNGATSEDSSLSSGGIGSSSFSNANSAAAIFAAASTTPPSPSTNALKRSTSGPATASTTPGGRSKLPPSAQTKAVVQMIAQSHAMAAASYGSGHLSSSLPAFLQMSPAGPSGRAVDFNTRVTIADPGAVGSSGGGRKEPKLLFTADEAASAGPLLPSAYPGASGGVSGGGGENNFEKARLFRRVPPRAAHDRSYITHNYINTTCGAFSAHHLGFKQAGGGGLLKTVSRLYDTLGKHAADESIIRSKLEGDAAADAPPNPNVRMIHALLESGQRVLSAQWENQQRQHTVLAQAMTALATSFVAHLLSSLHAVDTWRRIVRIGYLQQVESLLSTFHSEQYMMQDMAFSVRALEHVKFTIVEQPDVRDEHEETVRKTSEASSMSAPPPPPPPPPSPPQVPTPLDMIDMDIDNDSEEEEEEEEEEAEIEMDRHHVAISAPPSPPPPPPPAPPGGAATALLPLSAPPSRPPSPPPPAPMPPPPEELSPPPQVSTPPPPAAGIVAPIAVTPAIPPRPAPPIPRRPTAVSSSPVPTGTTGSATSSSPDAATPASLRDTVSPLTVNTAASRFSVSPLALGPSAAKPTPISPLARGTFSGPRGAGSVGASGMGPVSGLGLTRGPARGVSSGPGPSHEDFVSAEDDVAANEAGTYPSVHTRVSDLSTVHVSLLLPATAAPVAGLPYATDAPEHAEGPKRSRWFSLSNSGVSSPPPDSWAALAAAEAATKAASSIPFASLPSLPHPYSASSVVIVVELPSHLYKLLPACLREIARPTTHVRGHSANSTGDGSAKAGEEDATNSSSASAASPPPIPVLSSADGEAPQLSTPLIDVCPVMITQGVNELQTMANKVGKTDLQQQINLYSLEVIKSYFVAYAKYQKHHLDLISASSKDRLKNGSVLQMIGKDLQACEIMIQSFNAEKNIQLLVLIADIVKKMNGGRIICCKSAKDRTSMAVTWDQARVLYEQHGLSDHDVQTALNLMRTEGVRKLNVVKNTGQSAYAFNVLQRSFLPAIFRPPENACSSSIDG